VWRAAPVLCCSLSILPLCGITDNQNITRCGMSVKDFLPLCGKKWSNVEEQGL
jgi:hypothetical protein